MTRSARKGSKGSQRPQRRDDRAKVPAASDPVRSMQLLWGLGKLSGRGPRPGLRVEQIVAAAIVLADREGLEAVSMRRVAEEMGVATMSLYTYLPGKAELLELMHDAAQGEETWAFAAGSGWREKLELLARRGWDFYLRHPWMLEIPWAQAPLGPNSFRSYDRALSAVTGTGLGGREMANVVNLISTFLRGAALAAVEAMNAHRRSGVDDDRWWQARAPLLEAVLDPQRFPTLCSPELAGAFDAPTGEGGYYLAHAREAFEFGLQRLLEGIEALVQRRAAP
jgi:AcrR family transcriptional regulator